MPPLKDPYRPQIYSYLKKYQEDPHSRVFAPLAEAYRKAGLIDEAIEIAQEGLLRHPGFVGGKVALARALFDKKKYLAVADALAAVVKDVPDNLMAQRLMAESCLILGRRNEALTAYKMLLYFMPSDDEIAKMVAELEVDVYESDAAMLRTDWRSEFQVASLPPENESRISAEDRALAKAKKIKKIEFLQSLLQRIERYRIESREAILKP